MDRHRLIHNTHLPRKEKVLPGQICVKRAGSAGRAWSRKLHTITRRFLTFPVRRKIALALTVATVALHKKEGSALGRPSHFVLLSGISDRRVNCDGPAGVVPSGELCGAHREADRGSGGIPLNEKEIIQELQISRTPFREAINALNEENLVQIFPNRGIFVREGR